MGMSTACKVIIGIVVGLVAAGGIVVIVLAATGQFSSSSSCNAPSYTPTCTATSNISVKCLTPSVNFTAGSGTTQFTIKTNNVPAHAMDGGSAYPVCPTEFMETFTIPTKNPCAANQYHNGTSCANLNPAAVQPTFKDMGIIGLPPTKAKHWSATNVPTSVAAYDPLPAECGDVAAHNCRDTYTGQKRFSVLDVQRLSKAGTTVTYDDGSKLNLALDSYNAHVQPQGGASTKDSTTGIYHYHGTPKWDDGTYADYVIGYGFDGFPIMGRGSKLKTGAVAKSNYVEATDSGKYHMSYTYNSGNGGNLDAMNGGTVTIDGADTYAYFSTAKYPYVMRNFHGAYTQPS